MIPRRRTAESGVGFTLVRRHTHTEEVPEEIWCKLYSSRCFLLQPNLDLASPLLLLLLWREEATAGGVTVVKGAEGGEEVDYGGWVQDSLGLLKRNPSATFIYKCNKMHLGPSTLQILLQVPHSMFLSHISPSPISRMHFEA